MKFFYFRQHTRFLQQSEEKKCDVRGTPSYPPNFLGTAATSCSKLRNDTTHGLVGEVAIVLTLLLLLPLRLVNRSIVQVVLLKELACILCEHQT